MVRQLGQIATAAALLHGPGAELLRAQAVLAGTVRESGTGRPLAGAEVIIQAAGRRAVTDAAGRYLIAGLPFGVHLARARLVGYHPVELRVYLAAPDTLRADLELEPAAARLDPVEVTGREPVGGGLAGFASRRALGFGRFLEPAELRRAEHLTLPDLLRRLDGVRMVRAGSAVVAVNQRQDDPPCYLQVFVDGVSLYAPRPGTRRQPPDLRSFEVNGLEAVELYRSAAETPAEFGGAAAGCGTLVLWTRRPERRP